MMTTRKSLNAMICAVVAGAAAAVAMRLPELSRWSTTDLLAFGALVAATVLGEQFSVKVRYGSETKHITLTEASFAAALLLGVRPGVLTVAVAMGILVAYTAKGTAAHKVAFNVGSYVLAVTAAEVVYGSSLNSVSPLLAVAVAMGAFFVVNAGTVLGAISLATGRSLTQVLAPIATVEVTHVAGNLGLGALAAALWWAAPAALPAAVVVPVVCLTAYRALSPARSRSAG